MIKKTGAALVGLLIVLAAIVAFSGALKPLWPSAQSSPTAQHTADPSKPIDTFPITFLGTLKNQKTKVDVVEATVGIVQKEYNEKISASEDSYNKIIGTIDSPGIFGTGLAALLTMYGTAMYKNKTMWNEQEVNAIKNGGGVTV